MYWSQVRTRQYWFSVDLTVNAMLSERFSEPPITKESLKIGTQIVVDGYQTRDHSLLRANGRNITFPDGRKLFLGSSGTGAPTDGADPTEPGKGRGRGRGGNDD